MTAKYPDCADDPTVVVTQLHHSPMATWPASSSQIPLVKKCHLNTSKWNPRRAAGQHKLAGLGGGGGHPTI